MEKILTTISVSTSTLLFFVEVVAWIGLDLSLNGLSTIRVYQLKVTFKYNVFNVRNKPKINCDVSREENFRSSEEPRLKDYVRPSF